MISFLKCEMLHEYLNLRRNYIIETEIVKQFYI